MRILFITNNYKPYSGGVVSSIDATAQEMRAQGHDVTIVTLNFLGFAHNDEPHVIRVTCPVRFMYKNNHMAIPWRSKQTLLSIVKAYMPDVIHVHHPFLLGESGLEVARMLDVPCFFTQHTFYEEFAHYVPVPLLCSKPIIRWMVKRFCSLVDGIIVPSSGVKNYVREQGIITPLEIIPSALRMPFLSCDDYKGKKENNFFELLLVSRFTKEKNIPFVFDVFKRLPDTVRLTLVGYGSEYDNLRELAFHQLRLPQERVRFIHKPEQHHLIELYRGADLFIFPSLSDTQGIVLIEAMSQGLPVVAIDGPGQRDCVRNGENGFIVSDDISAADVIQSIIINTHMYQRLVCGARATAQLYCPAQQVRQLLSFYDNVLGL